jgi:phosphoribosyl-AMP cyclohydrolase / phosphoribosyl-ATP pyrophosphohydrolase
MQPQSFDDKGLVPCIVQDASSGTVLMLAFMNAEAHRLTVETGVVHFWSRSRQALWKKGETSGHTLSLVELRLDCDRDAVLVRVTPAGPTCHTGTTSCFYRVADDEAAAAGEDHPAGERHDDGVPAPVTPTGTAAAAASPDSSAEAHILDQLSKVIEARKRSTAEKSYTRSLLDGGPAKINGKIREESGELCDELDGGPTDKIAHEAADLLFHVLVGLAVRDVPLEEVWKTLRKRLGTSGHVEKASRGPA